MESGSVSNQSGFSSGTLAPTCPGRWAHLPAQRRLLVSSWSFFFYYYAQSFGPLPRSQEVAP